MQEKITAFIKENKLLQKQATVLLGVSGGPDSMALLHYFYMIREKWDLNVIVVSANHQLRGEEGLRDLEFVERECKKRNITFIGTSLDVPAYKKTHRVGTQVAARELRYQFYMEQMKAEGADYLALGHHGDDQIETMLMALVRTGSSTSFSGMPMKRSFANGYLIRPLLCVTKTEIETYCDACSIIPRLDPSNKETTYTRNYYRKYVVPKLKEKNQNLHRTIHHLSESLLDDEHYMMEEARKVFQTIVLLDSNEKQASLDSSVFKTYSTALQRRVYHLILTYLYKKLPVNLSYSHEENFFRMLMSAGNTEIDFPSHLKIKKSYQKLLFYFQSEPSKTDSFQAELRVPDEIHLPNELTLITSYVDKVEKDSPYVLLIPLQNVSFPLYVRTRRPGDRMSWKGLSGTKKLKDVFIDEKVPIEKRDSWPIVTDGNGSVLWLVGLRKKQFDLTKDTDLFVKVVVKNDISIGGK